jgi:3-hydroxyacyl-CoA dehydrogenase
MKKIKTVGVVGAGTMGSAIAQKFAQEGFTVYLNDRELKFVEKGITGIRTILEQGIERKLHF